MDEFYSPMDCCFLIRESSYVLAGNHAVSPPRVTVPAISIERALLATVRVEITTLRSQRLETSQRDQARILENSSWRRIHARTLKAYEMIVGS